MTRLLWFFTVVILGLQGCAGTAQPRRSVSVTPGQMFESRYVNITAPNSDGWQLAHSSAYGMTFAKRGQAANETYGAQVLLFNLAPTNTPQELEALMKASADAEKDPRFDIRQVSFKYSAERSYPCVRYHSLAQDNAPQGVKGPLLLESDGLYCRHPMWQRTGFAVIYSHRGESLYANLRSEAENFIQGVQVPSQ